MHGEATPFLGRPKNPYSNAGLTEKLREEIFDRLPAMPHPSGSSRFCNYSMVDTPHSDPTVIRILCARQPSPRRIYRLKQGGPVPPCATAAGHRISDPVARGATPKTRSPPQPALHFMARIGNDRRFGWCCRPATRHPQRSLAQRLSQDWRVRSFMPVHARSLCPTGKLIPTAPLC